MKYTLAYIELKILRVYQITLLLKSCCPVMKTNKNRYPYLVCH